LTANQNPSCCKEHLKRQTRTLLVLFIVIVLGVNRP